MTDHINEGDCVPVSVSRTVDARPETVFALLADPSIHPSFDGSGMLVEPASESMISGVGDSFVMKMHNDEMGSYEMTNYVVEYETDRRIGWEPVLTGASRPEDKDGIGDPAYHRWAFELVGDGPTATVVTETFDCSKSPEWLRRVLNNGERWREDMTRSLEKLDALARERQHKP